MGEKINKEFEEFQKELEIRNRKMKYIVHFNDNNKDDQLEEMIKELKDKKVIL